jgi:tRNA pseudouridine13 synthase
VTNELKVFMNGVAIDRKQTIDWQLVADNWSHAYGKPESVGRLKAKPSDFKVHELIDIDFSGAGEHYWLNIEKESLNSADVIRELSKFSGVKQKDIGYSGMKDKHAVTSQWFSLWMPKQTEPNWGALSAEGIRLLRVEKHNRKLRISTHKHKRFEIKIRQFCGDIRSLEKRIDLIKHQGVPNYFGLQRFGNRMLNLKRAQDYFAQGTQIRDKRLRSLLYSATRSWLFNCMLDKRVSDGSWNQLIDGEVAILDGSNSHFYADHKADQNLPARVSEMDVHPAHPLIASDINSAWQEMLTSDAKVANSLPHSLHSLIEMQDSIMNCYPVFSQALVASTMSLSYRALRANVLNFDWQIGSNKVVFKFDLLAGQFATSVIRELIDTAAQSDEI